MMTSAECRAKATEASAQAKGVADEPLRAHFEAMAGDWGRLAVTALAQEVMEAEIAGRENFLA